MRSIHTYTVETRPETSKTRQILEATEMKVVRKIAGEKLTYRVISENIRRMCGLENINNWVIKKKQEWNKHINRMDENRLGRRAQDTSLIGFRSVERHVNVGATIYQLNRHR